MDDDLVTGLDAQYALLYMLPACIPFSKLARAIDFGPGFAVIYKCLSN
jgi:hypothetical protein